MTLPISKWDVEEDIIENYEWKTATPNPFLESITLEKNNICRVTSLINVRSCLKDWIESLPTVRIGWRKYRALEIEVKEKFTCNLIRYCVYFKKYELLVFDKLIEKDQDGIREIAILKVSYIDSSLSGDTTSEES